MSNKQNKITIDEATNVALCTCAAIRKASRMVTQMYDAGFQDHGIKAGQFSLLATLAKSGAMTLTVLADVLVMDRTTLTRNLKPLERDGLIRIDVEDDQRARRISLTAAGVAKFDELYPIWVELQSKLVDGFGLNDWSGFISDLKSVVSVARKS